MARTYGKPRWPDNAKDLGRALADPEQFREFFPDSGPNAWADFANSYAAASPVVSELEALAKQEALQALEGTKAPKGGLGGTGRPQGKAKAWRKRPPGEILDSLITEQPHPLQAFLHAIDGKREDDASQNLRTAMSTKFANAGMSERVPGSGGFLVPEVLRDLVLANVLEASIVRPLARPILMDSLRVPLPVVDDTDHTQSVYGGVAGFWTAEGATLAASAPKWARTDLEARKLTAYTTIPQEMLEDSVTPLDDWFNLFFPRAIAWFEDVAFISGSGVGEPQGFLNSEAAIKVATTDAHTFTFADIVNCYQRIYPPCLTSPSLRWMCSPDARGQLLSMAFSASLAVSPPPWLAGMQMFDEPTMKIFGIPVCMSEKMPSSLSGNTTAPGALALVDFGHYMLGDRQSMQMAVSQEFLFASDLVAYRCIERLDGRIWQSSPILPANGSSQTLSPVVLSDTTG